tara:strand:- start:461 stop:694 length:234 start_codon:yes stop_codon:yes gene_type:complete
MNLKTLQSDWNLMRFIRLGLGLYIGIQAYQTQSILSGILASFLLDQVITNTGCCGSNGCSLPIKKSNPNSFEESTTK